MTGITKIENHRTINLSGMKTGDNNIEIHIPVDCLSGQLNSVLGDCLNNYMTKHKNVTSMDELCLDAKIIISCDGFCSLTDFGYSLFVTVWQVSDGSKGMDTTEYYEDIPLSFDSNETKKIKQAVWNTLGIVLLNF